MAITAVRDRLKQLQELTARREAVLGSLSERNLLTPELEKKVRVAETMTALEDVYLPYRPKRKTRASVAKEKGLEPLALLILEQGDIDPGAEAGKYLDPEKEVETVEDALAGARDIIAELAAEEQMVRERMRGLYESESLIASKVVKGHEEAGANLPGLLRLGGALVQGPFPPGSGHAAGGSGRPPLSADQGGGGKGPGHLGAGLCQGRQRRLRAGPIGPGRFP